MVRAYLSSTFKIRQCYVWRRSFRNAPAAWVQKMPDRPKPPPEGEFTEVFLKGSGPGGQKINKTSSAVQLKHAPTGIVVKVQDTRSQQQNRKLARAKLAERIENLEKGDASRTAVVQKSKGKKKQSAAKKSRRKYRALEAAKAETRNDDQKLSASSEVATRVNAGSAKE